MKRINVLEYLKEIKIDLKMQTALELLNSRREFDESNISLSFQHRDRIKRVAQGVGLDIDFISNKLVLKTPVGNFEIKSYNNRKKKSIDKDIDGVCQLSMLGIGDPDTILEVKPMEIGYSLDSRRTKYVSLFWQYVATDMNAYSTDLMNISSTIIEDNSVKADNNISQPEHVSKFIKPKAQINNEIKIVKE